MDEQALKKSRREARKLRNSLEILTKNVRWFIAQLDVVMAKPSSVERGKDIAELRNKLEVANDRIRHFDLDIDLKTGKKQRA